MAADADYLDDDEFDDYNPHPYAGGYDITATYGSPLPPSSATCYPVASRAATPAPTAPQPVPRSPLPQPPTSAPAPAPQPPRPSSPPAPAAEPYYWPKPYDYGDAPRHQPLYPTPEVFRGWPFLPPPVAPHCHCRSTCACARARARDYWRHCMRGLDYLFGHCDGYGERRIGVDSLGVPVYANTKGGVEDSVVVEVAPPATGTVQWHDDGEVQFQSNVSRYMNAVPFWIFLNSLQCCAAILTDGWGIPLLFCLFGNSDRLGMVMQKRRRIHMSSLPTFHMIDLMSSLPTLHMIDLTNNLPTLHMMDPTNNTTGFMVFPMRLLGFLIRAIRMSTERRNLNTRWLSCLDLSLTWALSSIMRQHHCIVSLTLLFSYVKYNCLIYPLVNDLAICVPVLSITRHF